MPTGRSAAGRPAGCRRARLLRAVRPLRVVAALAVAGLLVRPGTAAAEAASSSAAPPEAARGAYLFGLAGCGGCHTDTKRGGPPLAGGRAIRTPFGTFYGPNITPDPEHGIGGWSDADFLRALRTGRAPDGSHYYPVFPYAAFTRMTDADILAIKAYIFTLPAVPRPSRSHDIALPLRWRFLVGFWKWLNFDPGPFTPDPGRPAAWNRGAYLVRAVGHCHECHTPRDRFGGLDRARDMAGTEDGPDGETVPNITPDPETGIGRWSLADITFALRTGFLPDGDDMGGLMAEVVENGTSRLRDADLEAIAVYLKSLPPIRHRVARRPPGGAEEDW